MTVARILLVSILMVPASIAAGSAQAQTRVYGKVTYDKPVVSGAPGSLLEFTDSAPVRFATMYVRDKEDRRRIFDRTVTDAEGNYEMTIPASAGRVELRFVVFSRTARTAEHNVRVEKHRRQLGLGTMDWCCLDAADGGAFEIDIDIGPFQGRAFNVLDNGVRAQEYLRSLDPSLDFRRDPLKIVWHFPVKKPRGARYSPNGDDTVHLDWGDEWSDDVIVHEIGHWAQAHFSRDQNPGQSHNLGSMLDPRQAFSEGFAHYFAGVVRAHSGNVRYPDPGTGLRTSSSRVRRSYDLETQVLVPDMRAGNDDYYRTQVNQSAVAAALWDLVDDGTAPPFRGDDESFDSVGGKQAEIWSALVALGADDAQPTTFEAWYRKFLMIDSQAARAAAGTWSIPFAVDGAFERVGIRFYEDGPMTAWSGSLTEPNDGGLGAGAWHLDEAELPAYFTMFADEGVDPLNRGDVDSFVVIGNWQPNGVQVTLTVDVRRVQRYRRAPGYLDDGANLQLEVRRVRDFGLGWELEDPTEVFRDDDGGTGLQDRVTIVMDDPEPGNGQLWAPAVLIIVHRSDNDSLSEYGYYCLDVDTTPVQPGAPGERPDCDTYRR